jgi:hypothetical protein
MASPIRIFVGCAPDGHDAESQAALDHSLRSRCAAPVEITWMFASRDPASPFHGWDMRRWATPFSGFRWAAPELCGFRGRAIYMDSDVVVLGDIGELWETDLRRGRIVTARNPSKFCVSLWDCAAAKPYMLPLPQLRRADGHDRQSAYFRQHPGLVRSFGSAWNWLDSEDADLSQAKICHYTDMRSQPHLNYAIPRLIGEGRAHWYDGPLREGRRDVTELFEREYAAARAAGYTVDRYIPAERFGPFRKRSMAGYRAQR